MNETKEEFSPPLLRRLSPKIAFLLVSFSLGELGDGLNIFQGIYLVGIGWNESLVGAALSLMGLTALLVQPFAGDLIDKAGVAIDRRVFLIVASVVTALSASTVLLVHVGNTDHWLIFISKIIEGVSSSFIGPCLAALTLATFGPNHFDAIMASNVMWGHIGSVVAAILAGGVAFVLYPNIKYCFLVIGASALVAIMFVQYLPQGDALMGRGFQGKMAMDEDGHMEDLQDNHSSQEFPPKGDNTVKDLLVEKPPTASSYFEVFTDMKTCILCFTGFFFQYVQYFIHAVIKYFWSSYTHPSIVLLQLCQCQCIAGFGRIDGQ
jgi:MFS family permease